MANVTYLLNFTRASYPTSEPTSPKEDEIFELPQVVILCTVLAFASVMGTLGNSLVLLSIIKFDSLRAIPDFFIFSLSLSDFLVTAIFQPLKAYKIANFEQVSTNAEFLEISSFLGHFALIASISNMFGVTVERLVSIRFPLKYDFLVTKVRATFIIICIWIFSISYGAIWSRGLVSAKYLSIYFVLVLVGTVSIYFYIFLIARRLEDRTVQAQNESTDAEIPNRRVRRERKAAKTIAIILGVAVFCWLPLLIVPNVLPNDLDSTTFRKIFFPLQTLSVCNSSINPYIYCVRSCRYSVAFVKLLRLQRTFKVQAIDAPGLSAAYRNPALTAPATDAPRAEIQSQQGEIKDVAL